jgi:hypothetical protein
MLCVLECLRLYKYLEVKIAKGIEFRHFEKKRTVLLTPSCICAFVGTFVDSSRM